MSGAEARTRARLSRTGWAAIFTCLAIAAAAVNTGNNLLYLVLALVVAAFPVSFWWARASLGTLEAELLPPEDARAGQPFDVPLRVAASKKRGAAGVVLELAGRADLKAPSPRGLAILRGGDDLALNLRATLARRGDATLELLARSPFPFGLLDAARRIGRASLVVLPMSDPAWRDEVAPATEEGQARLERGSGTDILDIRDHRVGDDARSIDWKATARLDRPMVREFSRDESRRALIIVDAVRVPAGIDTAAAAEQAISRAATALESLAMEGWRVALLLPDGRRDGGTRQLLRELARVAVRPAFEGEWWLGQIREDEAALLFRSVAR